jgi:aspartate/methionine/tyrosine aminotransferase
MTSFRTTTKSGFLAKADLTPNSIELARQQAKDYIDLTSSNPTHQSLIFPPDILREAAEPYWAKRRYNPDPRGHLAAREAITDYYSHRTPSLNLDPANVFITASTSEAYSLLFALLTEPGDNVLAPNVTYPLFEHLAAVHHIHLKTYTLDEARGWQIDEHSLLDQADDRTQAVLIVSPHNPTGRIVGAPLPTLDRLGLPVICDEVFAEFTYRASHAPPLGALHHDLPIFHLNGISKMFALPDLKLGWIAMSQAASAQFAARFEILNDAFLGANSLTQFMLPTLFEHGIGFVEHMTRRIRHSLDLALRTLADCPRIRAQPPDGGTYLFPRVLDCDGEEALVLRLLEQGVLVHPGYFYGCEDGAHIMISCLTEPSNLKQGLQRLVAALA